LAIDSISRLFEMVYQVIVFHAVALIFEETFSMLISYKTDVIKFTDRLQLIAKSALL
jgi:uncharacterized YccA/Bax inhibitor family protein